MIKIKTEREDKRVAEDGPGPNPKRQRIGDSKDSSPLPKKGCWICGTTQESSRTTPPLPPPASGSDFTLRELIRSELSPELLATIEESGAAGIDVLCDRCALLEGNIRTLARTVRDLQAQVQVGVGIVKELLTKNYPIQQQGSHPNPQVASSSSGVSATMTFPQGQPSGALGINVKVEVKEEVMETEDPGQDLGGEGSNTIWIDDDDDKDEDDDGENDGDDEDRGILVQRKDEPVHKANYRNLLTSTPPIICKVCKEQFDFDSDLTIHEYVLHKNGQDFFKRINAAVRKEARIVKCGKCPKHFRTNAFLQEHLFDRHQEQAQWAPPPFNCFRCTRTFDSEMALKSHMNFHMEIIGKLNRKLKKQGSENEDRNSIDDLRPVICAQKNCQERFDTLIMMEAHYGAIHLEENLLNYKVKVKDVQCIRCVKRFAKIDHMKSHWISKHKTKKDTDSTFDQLISNAQII